MKKILLTTSALTLLAGAAAADVSVGGYARIKSLLADGATTNYLRNQITFSGSATTDGGLTLGTWTRYRHSAGASVVCWDWRIRCSTSIHFKWCNDIDSW